MLYAPNQDGFDSLARLYADLEGMDTFKELILEIEQVKENNDFPYFMDAVERFEIKSLNQAGLEAMAETAIKVYKELTIASP